MQNIFNNLNKLHTPEWFKLVNPAGLIDRVMSCLKFLLNIVSRCRAHVGRYRFNVQRKDYFLLTVNISNILNTSNFSIAGITDNALYTKFPYRVTNMVECDIIGCGYTDYIGIKNIDYIYHSGCCWFREDPTKFFYSYGQKDKIVYYTVAFGSNYSKLIKSYSPLSDIESTPTSIQMYDNLVNNGFNGISNAYSLYQKGIYTNGGVHGIVTDVWKEKNYYCIITNTKTFICIPEHLNIIPIIGEHLNIK